MTNPYLNRYRNAEYIQYMKDVLALLEPHNVKELNISQQKAALNTAVIELRTVFKQAQSSSLTPEIVALDERRDKAIVGLRTMTQGFSYHFDPNIAEAATLLNGNIASHGNNISRMGYQEKTAILDSIMEDWKSKAALPTAVNTLGIANWLQELEESNQQFATMYLERVGESAQSPTITVSDLRNQTTEAYRTLVSHIHAHATLSSTETHASILNEISILAGQYNQVVDNRSTTTPTDPEPLTEPNTPSSMLS